MAFGFFQVFYRNPIDRSGAVRLYREHGKRRKRKQMARVTIYDWAAFAGTAVHLATAHNPAAQSASFVRLVMWVNMLAGVGKPTTSRTLQRGGKHFPG